MRKFELSDSVYKYAKPMPEVLLKMLSIT